MNLLVKIIRENWINLREREREIWKKRSNGVAIKHLKYASARRIQCYYYTLLAKDDYQWQSWNTREGTCWTLQKSSPPLSTLSLNVFGMYLISNSWRVVTNLNPSGILFNLWQFTICKRQRLGMAPSSTLHSSKSRNWERTRDWSWGNPLSEQTIIFPSNT